MALLTGTVNKTVDYMNESPGAIDPRVDRLRTTIEVVRDKASRSDYYDRKKRSCCNAIRVFLNGGRAMEDVVVEYPIGHPDRADTFEHLQKKTRKNLGLELNDERIDEIFRAVGIARPPFQDFRRSFRKDERLTQYIHIIEYSGVYMACHLETL